MTGPLSPEGGLPHEAQEFVGRLPGTEAEGVHEVGAALSVKHERKGLTAQKPYEDRMLFAPESNAFGVFDGVGGEPNGDQAAERSKNAIASFIKDMPTDISPEESVSYLRNHIRELTQQLYQDEEAGYTAMGLGYFHDTEDGKKFISVNVADTRIYRLREGQLASLTIDNEDPFESRAQQRQRQTQKGLQGISDELNQAIGSEDVLPIIDIHDVEQDDTFLLVTDGITKNLTDTRIAQILTGPGTAASKTRQMVLEARAIANNQDTFDDMTVEIIESVSALPTREPVQTPPPSSFQVRPELAREYGDTIAAAKEILGRELTASELYYLTSDTSLGYGGNVDYIKNVEPLYRKLRKARNNPATQREVDAIEARRATPEAETYKFLEDERTVALSAFRIESQAEWDAYVTLQDLPEGSKKAIRGYFHTNDTSEQKPQGTKTVITVRYLKNPVDEEHVMPRTTVSYEQAA